MKQTSESEKLFDLELIEAMDDTDYTRDMISSYIDETPSELKIMSSSLKGASVLDLAKTAHKLKSSTAVFQSQRLVGLFDNIEKSAKSGQPTTSLKIIFDEIMQQYKMLEAALKGQLQLLPKS